MLRSVLIAIIGIVACSESIAQSNDVSEAQPVQPPVPSYPPMAASLGLQGYCEVRFSVDESGSPFGLQTGCTQPVFCYQSKLAVSRSIFEPKRIDGRAVPRFDVVYPLEYRLRDRDVDFDRDNMEPCSERATS